MDEIRDPGASTLGRARPMRGTDGPNREAELPRENERAAMALESARSVAKNLAEKLHSVLRTEEIEDNAREKENEPTTEVGRVFRHDANEATRLAEFLQDIINRLEV